MPRCHSQSIVEGHRCKKKMPSRGPKRGRKCCVTPAFSGVQSQAWGENHKWLPQPCLLGSPKEGGSATSPKHSRGSPTPSAGRKSEVATATLPSQGPKRGRKCYATHAFPGSPTPCAERKSEVAASPLHSRGSPNKGGQNHKWLPHPCLLGGPKEGGNATARLHSRGSPNKAGQNQKWLPHPCLLGGQKRAKMLRYPCILGDPQTKGDKIRSGCLTPAFSGAKMLRHPCILGDLQTKWDKIRSGCFTPAFSGAQKRVEVLCHPCILGVPNARRMDKIRSGPQVGTSPTGMHFE